VIADRVNPYRDTRRPQRTEAIEWPEYFRGAEVIVSDGSRVSTELGALGRPYSVGHGTPMQAIPDGAPLVRVWVTDAMNDGAGAHLERLPIPPPSTAWITGRPTPMFDRRWLGVYSDGSVRQCVQLTWVRPNPVTWFLSLFRPIPSGPHWECMTTGLFDRAGRLVKGTAGTAARVSCATYVPTPESLEAGSLLHMTLSDYGGGDGELEVSFPRCGDWLVNTGAPPPDDLNGVARTLWVRTMTHGVLVVDRYGDDDDGVPDAGGKLTTQAGAAGWVGAGLDRVRIPLEAFVKVIE